LQVTGVGRIDRGSAYGKTLQRAVTRDVDTGMSTPRTGDFSPFGKIENARCEGGSRCGGCRGGQHQTKKSFWRKLEGVFHESSYYFSKERGTLHV
jgi:hypothetical protein